MKTLIDAARFWGVWPCAVMVLSQLGATRILGMVLPPHIIYLTVAGTLAVYGADRFLEQRFLTVTAIRHQARGIAHVFSGGLILGFLLAATPNALDSWRWLLQLGIAGCCYLAATTNRLKTPLLFKEVLGAWIFCYLILGWAFDRVTLEITALFLLGFANFLRSGYQDLARDRQNEVPSFAKFDSKSNITLARVAGTLSFILFVASAGLYSPFALTACCHALWPAAKTYPIDLAFSPLLLVPLLVAI